MNKRSRLSLGPGYEQFPSSPGSFHTAGSGLIPQRSKSDSHRGLLGTLAPYGQTISENPTAEREKDRGDGKADREGRRKALQGVANVPMV